MKTYITLQKILIKKHKAMINSILEFNKSFVENKEYERFITNKYPDKK